MNSQLIKWDSIHSELGTIVDATSIASLTAEPYIASFLLEPQKTNELQGYLARENRYKEREEFRYVLSKLRNALSIFEKAILFDYFICDEAALEGFSPNDTSILNAKEIRGIIKITRVPCQFYTDTTDVIAKLLAHDKVHQYLEYEPYVNAEYHEKPFHDRLCRRMKEEFVKLRKQTPEFMETLNSKPSERTQAQTEMLGTLVKELRGLNHLRNSGRHL